MSTATTSKSTTQLARERVVSEAVQTVEDAMSFMDAALAVAGHAVTDPIVRDLIRSSARGDITGDEAVERAVAHIRSR